MIGRNSRNIFVFGVAAAIVAAVFGGAAVAADPDPKSLLSKMSAEIATHDSYEIAATPMPMRGSRPDRSSKIRRRSDFGCANPALCA